VLPGAPGPIGLCRVARAGQAAGLRRSGDQGPESAPAGGQFLYLGVRIQRVM